MAFKKTESYSVYVFISKFFLEKKIRLDVSKTNSSGVVVYVEAWLIKEPVIDQYIEYKNSFGLILNYIRRVGIVKTFQKIKSRILEFKRNQKESGIGVGYIVDCNYSKNITSSNKKVIFFAANFGTDWEFIETHKDFVRTIESIDVLTENKATEDTTENTLNLIRDLSGYSLFAGHIPCRELIADMQAAFENCLSIFSNSNQIQHIKEYRNTLLANTKPYSNNSSARPQAVLFGLGNYAKTQIVPNVKKYIDIRRIHEVDPDQLSSVGRSKNQDITTSATHLGDRKFDVWFIAGYHHTHTELAIEALKNGGIPVIEKPICTKIEQLLTLKKKLSENADLKFFSCFQKRYGKLHQWALEDLNVGMTGIDMHCVIYEIPLPKLHWYNWYNSGSRLISNGCHWIDYFFFVNSYCPVRNLRVDRVRGNELSVQIWLENEAYFSMNITENGSKRVGVRENIELRQGDVLVRVIDAEYYHSENSRSIVRKGRVEPTSAHSAMYKEITRKIYNQMPGDSIDSLYSTEITLFLEKELKDNGKAR